MMNALYELAKGIAIGNYRGRILPDGLPQDPSCIKCSYGGEDNVVNFCRRSTTQKCKKMGKK